MSTQKTPPEDTKGQYVPHDPRIPSAPPMEMFAGAPPSYDQVIAASNQVMPTPYYMPLQPGKGCVLLLQFPCQDVDSVSECFKGDVPNMLLHEGKVMAFIPEMQFFPSHKTSAVVVHFGSERTALSWLQNMKSSCPEPVSRWWAMIAENTAARKLPANYNDYKVLSIVVLKRKPGYVESKADAQEYSQLYKDAVTPVMTRHNVQSIVSRKLVFACGDWSNFQARASELVLAISLFPSSDHRAAYIHDFTHEPKLKRFTELSNLKNTRLFISGFPTGDVCKFQDI